MIGNASLRRHLPVLAVLAIGLSATIFMFRLTSNFEHARSDREFERAADSAEAMARNALDELEYVLDGLGGLYAASQAVDRDEFAAYASLVRERGKGIQALEWIPRVVASEVDEYRQAAIESGLDGFEIRERSSDGEMIPVAPQDTYYPVYYVDPLVGNEQAIGFDLGSEDGRREALLTARDSGEKTAVPVTLVQEAGSQTGLLLFSPVYRNGESIDTLEERRESLEGFVLAVYRIADLLTPVIAQGEASGLHLQIFDAVSGKELLFSSELHSEGHTLEELQADPEVQLGELRVANERWMLALHRGDAHVVATRDWLPPATGGAGLLITVLAAVFIVTVTGRARRVELLVGQRTSQLRAAQEALREEYGQTEQVLGAIASVLVGVRRDGTVNLWNHAAEETSGIMRADAMDAPVASVPASCLQQPALMQALQRCAADGGRQRLDRVSFERRDGQQGYLEVAIAAVTDADGNLTGALLTATDITERLTLEAQLTQAQKLESIGQLAAGIAHEINTPTQFVGDNARFVRDAFRDLKPLFRSHDRLLSAAEETGAVSEELIEQAREAVRQSDIEYLESEIPSAIEQTLEGVERVATIVRAMKDFSHPGSDLKEPTDLNAALESTITVARSEWRHAADVELDLTVDLPPVPCLAAELNQAFLNIIINAAHAIETLTDGHEKGVITVSSALDGEWAELRIRDTGGGIPDEIRERIFDPFFTTKGVGRGTGQGLAIARSVVVEKHGGKLEVESESGVGTTFIIRLPLRDPAAKAA